MTVIRNLTAKTQAFAYVMTQRQRRMFVRWTAALCYLMRSHILSYVHGSLVLDGVLTAGEIEWLRSRAHAPMAATQIIGALLNSVAGMRDHAHIPLAQIHLELSNYMACVTNSERIVRTPIPPAYSR